MSTLGQTVCTVDGDGAVVAFGKSVVILAIQLRFQVLFWHRRLSGQDALPHDYRGPGRQERKQACHVWSRSEAEGVRVNAALLKCPSRDGQQQIQLHMSPAVKRPSVRPTWADSRRRAGERVGGRWWAGGPVRSSWVGKQVWLDVFNSGDIYPLPRCAKATLYLYQRRLCRFTAMKHYKSVWRGTAGKECHAPWTRHNMIRVPSRT